MFGRTFSQEWVFSTFPISVRFPLKSHGIEKQPRHGYIDAHDLSRKMRNAHFTPPRRQGCLEISRLRPDREKNDKSTKPEKSAPYPSRAGIPQILKRVALQNCLNNFSAVPGCVRLIEAASQIFCSSLVLSRRPTFFKKSAKNLKIGPQQPQPPLTPIGSGRDLHIYIPPLTPDQPPFKGGLYVKLRVSSS